VSSGQENHSAAVFSCCYSLDAPETTMQKEHVSLLSDLINCGWFLYENQIVTFTLQRYFNRWSVTNFQLNILISYSENIKYKTLGKTFRGFTYQLIF